MKLSSRLCAVLTTFLLLAFALPAAALQADESLRGDDVQPIVIAHRGASALCRPARADQPRSTAARQQRSSSAVRDAHHWR